MGKIIEFNKVNTKDANNSLQAIKNVKQNEKHNADYFKSIVKQYIKKAQDYYNMYDGSSESFENLDKAYNAIKDGFKYDSFNPYLYFELYKIMHYKNPYNNLKNLENARNLAYLQNRKDRKLILSIERCLLNEYALNDDYINIRDISNSIIKLGYKDYNLLMDLGLANEMIALDKRDAKKYSESNSLYIEAVLAYQKAINLCKSQLKYIEDISKNPEQDFNEVDSMIMYTLNNIFEATYSINEVYSINNNENAIRRQNQNLISIYDNGIKICENILNAVEHSYITDDEFIIIANRIVQISDVIIDKYVELDDVKGIENQIKKALEFGPKKELIDRFNKTLIDTKNRVEKKKREQTREKRKQKLKIISVTTNSKLK